MFFKLPRALADGAGAAIEGPGFSSNRYLICPDQPFCATSLYFQ
jgi:hypothetical protein